MRVLVIGAGGIGGYFGGRLAAAGRDVTFLVRPARAEILRTHGLSISSQFGGVHIASPQLASAAGPLGTYDLLLVSCKAYDLEDATASFAPAVGASTMILPLLNGVAHLDAMIDRFGNDAVLGGTCFISTTVKENGIIAHMNDTHRLTYGELGGGVTARIEALSSLFEGVNFDAAPSVNIVQNMWDKWVFIASSAGMTCLMRSPIGDYVAAGAAPLADLLVGECAAVATAAGYAPSDAALEDVRSYVTKSGSAITTSMLRDIESGARIEADHIVGEMLKRAHAFGLGAPMLTTVHSHLKSYEHRRSH